MCHSILLQGICNARKIFTNIYVSSPGNMHDARVLQNSRVYEIAESGVPGLLLPEQHIIGDSAYPLKTWLLSPYRDTGHLTHMERRFNKRLSQTRVTIEHAFGALKNRFRRLLLKVDANPLHVCNIVQACCVLHNICQADTGKDSDLENVEISTDDKQASAASVDDSAKMKRHKIAEFYVVTLNISPLTATQFQFS